MDIKPEIIHIYESKTNPKYIIFLLVIAISILSNVFQYFEIRVCDAIIKDVTEAHQTIELNRTPEVSK